jgi:hypothetical protein
VREEQAKDYFGIVPSPGEGNVKAHQFRAG